MNELNPGPKLHDEVQEGSGVIFHSNTFAHLEFVKRAAGLSSFQRCAAFAD